MDFEEYGKFGAHWSSEKEREMLLYWIKQKSRNGIFDLGCKHPSLNCYFLFKKRFKPFLEEINLYEFVSNNDRKGCCKNIGYNTKCDPIFFIFHFTMNNSNEQIKWYHMMVQVYVCEMCDFPMLSKQGHKN